MKRGDYNSEQHNLICRAEGYMRLMAETDPFRPDITEWIAFLKVMAGNLVKELNAYHGDYPTWQAQVHERGTWTPGSNDPDIQRVEALLRKHAG